MTTNLEVWRPIANYEGFYEVSSFGRVRSLDREIICGDGRRRKIKGKITRQSLKNKRYYCVHLQKDNKEVVALISHLVAEAFIGSRPEGMFVLHGENGSFDNSVQNLRYGTPTENNWDRLRDGTLPMGEVHGMSKLTEDSVRLIFYFYELGWHKKSIAKLFKITYQNVHAIISGKTWKHIIL